MPGLSPKLPVAKDPNDGFSLTKTYAELAHQNFKHLVLTSPGERIMDPNFGVGVRSFLFQQMTSFVFSDIENKIREQVSIYMPFIEIRNVFFDAPEEDEFSNIIFLSIEYFIISLGRGGLLQVTVN